MLFRSITKQGFKIFDLKGDIFECDARSLPRFDKKFDLVYSCGVLHHFPESDKTIDQIYNLLKNDGTFKFLVYAKNSWKYAMIQAGLDQYEAQDNCPYAVAYTNEEIHNLIGDKFNIEKIEQNHCFMYNIPKYKQNIFELQPWFAAMSEEMREAVSTKLGWHLMVTASKK